jgi:hypothetical protein
VAEDPGETHDRCGGAEERRLAERLRAALRELEAPDDQYLRLGLA